MAKQFKWQGLSLEQVQELDLAAFMQKISARARRSLSRGFSDAQKALLKRLDAGEDNVKTHCRDLVILPKMIGRVRMFYYLDLRVLG